MARLSRWLQEPIRKLWDAWSKLQANEDERWKDSVRGRPALDEDRAGASECGTTTQAPSVFASPKERPLGATGAPTLTELVARRQKENKLAGDKSVSQGAPDE